MTEKEIEELVNKFQLQTLPINEWTHHAHLTTAIWHLRKYTPQEAICYLRSGIITYNKSTGGENSPVKGYHETITLFWIKNIEHYLDENKSYGLVDVCNNFLKSPRAATQYPFKFYSRDFLLSTKARALWADPDLQPLDFDVM